MKDYNKALSALLVLLPIVVLSAPYDQQKQQTESLHGLALTDGDDAKRNEAIAAPEDVDFHDDTEEETLLALKRFKRYFYDRDPWGRIPQRKGPWHRRKYNRRQPNVYNTRKYSRGRRRKHRGDQGDQDDQDSQMSAIEGDTNEGLVDKPIIDPKAYDNQSKPKETFVSARSSGVARTVTTGTGID